MKDLFAQPPLLQPRENARHVALRAGAESSAWTIGDLFDASQ
jgi:hypothetical protein